MPPLPTIGTIRNATSPLGPVSCPVARTVEISSAMVKSVSLGRPVTIPTVFDLAGRGAASDLLVRAIDGVAWWNMQATSKKTTVVARIGATLRDDLQGICRSSGVARKM